jgi:hypothetical protein
MQALHRGPLPRRRRSAPPLATFPEGASVPRIIHQTFSRPLPEELADNLDRIRDQNPTWEHRFYDDQEQLDFTSESYGSEIAEYLERIRPGYGAARADLFRYLLLYRCGGVYLDVKSRSLQPLDTVLRPDDRFLLSQWRNGPGEPFEGFGRHRQLAHVDGGEFQQWHIIAAPGHPFLRAVIQRVLHNLDRYNPGLHGAGQEGVLRVTGPIAYTLAIHPLLDRHPHRRVRSEVELGLRYSIYDGSSHRDRLPAHYSKIHEPISEVGQVTRVLAAALDGARTIKQRLGGRPAPSPAIGPGERIGEASSG